LIHVAQFLPDEEWSAWRGSDNPEPIIPVTASNTIGPLSLAERPVMKAERLAKIAATIASAGLGKEAFWQNVLQGGDGNINNQLPPAFELEKLSFIPEPPPPPAPEQVTRVFSAKILNHEIQGRHYFFDVKYTDDSVEAHVELSALVKLPPDGLDEIDDSLLVYLREHRQLHSKGALVSLVCANSRAVLSELHERRYEQFKSAKAEKKKQRKRKREAAPNGSDGQSDPMEGLVDGEGETMQPPAEEGGSESPSKRPRRRAKNDAPMSYEEHYQRTRTDYQLTRHAAAAHDPHLQKILRYVPLGHGALH
jgi:hypothetical protein